MNCWAMRTSRDTEEHRKYLRNELFENNLLRQGWGVDETQNLDSIDKRWNDGLELNSLEKQTRMHWRMGNGEGEGYMQIRDLVIVPNMPDDGLFTICKVVGDYRFEIDGSLRDFGHIRPVEVLTPKGVSNNHERVHAGLRRSFRCYSRMWNINSYADCLKDILKIDPDDLAKGSTPSESIDSLVAEIITGPLNLMAGEIAKKFPSKVIGAEWEEILGDALKNLFPVSVHNTGGPYERGADLEIIIPNPFEEDRDWIIPIQVKDYDNEVGADVADQLLKAFETRSKTNRVIAVVLLASNAKASEELLKKLEEMKNEYHVPFLFGDGELFSKLLARGYLRRSS